MWMIWAGLVVLALTVFAVLFDRRRAGRLGPRDASNVYPDRGENANYAGIVEYSRSGPSAMGGANTGI
ncbi:hypothetical protein AB0M43_05175 [Longispora sp. NPDC051575]|uniref:hypothetical protein n=1 Tax=Longispora sp. NPDC051575 TaxID=3154943 RepID=UPI003436EA7D